MIKVITQVVKHCILSSQMPQDAVGSQFYTVYKEIMTTLFSQSTEHSHVQQMRNNKEN